MANSYPASGTVILDDLKVCTNARLQPHFVSYGEHMFMNLESAHNNSYLPVVTFSRAGCTLGAIGLERASNSDTVGNYAESEMIIGTRANTPTSIQTNGVRRMVITNSGNINIQGGSILSVYRADNTRALQLYTTSNESVIDSWESSSEPLHIRSMGAGGRIQFFTNGSERLRINCAGNIGIGITDPITKLHVEQSTSGEVGRFRANVAGCADLVLVNNAQTWGWRVDNAASNALHVRNFQNTTNIMTFTTGGGVGIGITSPATNLHICDANALGRDDMIRLTQGNVNNHAYLRSERCNGAMVLMGATRNSFDGCIPSDSGIVWSFCNNPIVIGSCNRERMRITGAGSVGIGTSSPSSKLDVSGTDGRIQSRVDSSDGSTINVRPNAGKCGWISYTEDAVADRWGIGVKNGDSKLYFASGNVGDGGGTTRMVIDGSGCIGINTTSPSYRLHVNGTFYAAGSSIEYKQGISQYDTDSCLFMCLKPKTYQYKDEWKHLGKDLKSGTQIGLIAEEVAEVMPELAVLVNEEENKVVRNVDYEKLSIILLSEVQKLRKEVDNIKNNK